MRQDFHKEKSEIKEAMERFVDRLQRIEEKVDFQRRVRKFLPRRLVLLRLLQTATNSSDNSSDDGVAASKKPAETSKNGSVKANDVESSSSEVQAIYTCCFDTEDAEGDNKETIFVKGFDSSLLRDDIKRALSKHFGSCEEITRGFVPIDIECNNGVSLGFVTSSSNSEPTPRPLRFVEVCVNIYL